VATISSDEIVVSTVRHTDFRPVRNLLNRTGHESMDAIEYHTAVISHKTAYLAKRGPQAVGLVWVESSESGVITISRLAVDLPGFDQQIAQQLLTEVMWNDPHAERMEMLIDEYEVDQQKLLALCGFTGKPAGKSIKFTREM